MWSLLASKTNLGGTNEGRLKVAIVNIITMEFYFVSLCHFLHHGYFGVLILLSESVRVLWGFCSCVKLSCLTPLMSCFWLPPYLHVLDLVKRLGSDQFGYTIEVRGEQIFQKSRCYPRILGFRRVT